MRCLRRRPHTLVAKAACTSSVRPHALVPEGRIHTAVAGLFALLEEELGQLHVRVTLPAKYPAVAVHVKLTCRSVH